ncbi:TssN family type VI secretion system protein [Pedobacter sp. MC2016-24]|uniref:TssN family type VI secretion system protein n=1 Tax=Pedobacter sp. MC2016-24 TaxID=2780090 RepID=UPI00187E26D9|nr:TssN family type VI secretion system protein [Pedobacter sp. MC2016-24]MBE9599394.1 TssN family type VI secretion system protein [Pedobacter sp. MC2016-24]
MDVKSFFIRFLLFPLIVLVSTAVLSIINKKNQFINNKRLIVSVLLIGIILAIPGFLGFLNFNFMPWGYIICCIFYLLMGTVFTYLLTKYYPKELLERKVFIFFATLISALLSVYLFQLAFNWLSSVNFGWFGAGSITCFFVPLIFWWAYVSLLGIPSEIYKIWKYPDMPLDINMDHVDFNKLLVLELELYRKSSDPEPLKVKVKALENMNFGIWFHKFIDDYNLKFTNNPIAFKSDDQENYKWIFFIKTSFFKRNIFIDPDLDIIENGITEKMTIYAKRVSENVNKSDEVGESAIFI